jgi:restriction system protein
LTPEERAQLLPSGSQTLFNNRVHWARTYLGKAGLIESTRRGYFKITPRGLQVVESKPPRIDVKFLGQFDEFKEFIERSRLAQGAANDQNPAAPANIRDMAAQPPNEIMLAAHRQIESALAQDLLDRIRIAPPDFFERLIVNLLLSMGFGVRNDFKLFPFRNRDCSISQQENRSDRRRAVSQTHDPAQRRLQS